MELLVVIGIIALLIGILLPSLARSRETAKRVQCLSNLRQMAVAAQTYAGNYHGYYPIAQYAAYDNVTTYNYCWDLTTVTTPGQPTRVVLGLLWDRSGNQAIQQCPSYEGSANYADNPYTGYNYNVSYVGHGEGEAVEAPAKAVQVRRSAEVALFGDGQYGAGADKFMRAPFPSPGDATFGGRWAGTQGYRHGGQTNVAYCDGHAASQRDRFTANKDGAANVAPRTGFLSADNRAYGGD